MKKRFGAGYKPAPAGFHAMHGNPPNFKIQETEQHDDLTFLPIEAEIVTIVETYLQHKLMPNDAGGDALHLAVASYCKCDILLSWNCKNLANANKFNHIRYVNNLLSLYVPILATPLELSGENHD